MSFTCKIDHDGLWLSVAFSRPLQIASWAVHRPGLVEAGQILWRKVNNSDLPLDVDPQVWLVKELSQRGALDAVTMLTSCDIGNYRVCEAQVEEAHVTAICTAGLSNAERVGARLDWGKDGWGTINLAVIIEQGLQQWALFEAMSIASEARTAAVYDADLKIATGRATGTGTDCIALAAPQGDASYAGLHTALGEAIGKAVYQATSQAVVLWKQSKFGQAF
nr:adenosylcobinamide amidohydrolase [uncultured Cohaesibacter sp.]